MIAGEKSATADADQAEAGAVELAFQQCGAGAKDPVGKARRIVELAVAGADA